MTLDAIEYTSYKMAALFRLLMLIAVIFQGGQCALFDGDWKMFFFYLAIFIIMTIIEVVRVLMSTEPID